MDSGERGSTLSESCASRVSFLPLLEFHPLGGSSVGRAEVLAGSSVGVFQFLLSPEAMSDLNINGVNTSSTAHINHSAPGSSESYRFILFVAFLPLFIYPHIENEFQNGWIVEYICMHVK